MILRISLTFLLALSFLVSRAQQRAITDKGDEVILYDDGTWKYVNITRAEYDSIPTNPLPFHKSPAAGFLVRSDKIGLGFWIDPKKWSFNKAGNNEDAEYEFQLKEGDLYGMAITEQVEIPMMTLRGIALNNGRKAAPDLQIIREEYRTVNGLKVLHMQMDGTIQGVKFSYYGYYYSNSGGTVQFLTYTAQHLLDKYRDACDELLNGMVEIQ